MVTAQAGQSIPCTRYTTFPSEAEDESGMSVICPSSSTLLLQQELFAPLGFSKATVLLLQQELFASLGFSKAAKSLLQQELFASLGFSKATESLLQQELFASLGFSKAAKSLLQQELFGSLSLVFCNGFEVLLQQLLFLSL
jgi:N-acetylglutamate synthase-like GNAT family acetyltransferase